MWRLEEKEKKVVIAGRAINNSQMSEDYVTCQIYLLHVKFICFRVVPVENKEVPLCFEYDQFCCEYPYSLSSTTLVLSAEWNLVFCMVHSA